MKKLFIAIALMAALVGCSKENADPKVAKLEAVLNVKEISKDILDNFTVTYEYKDFNGVSSSRAVTGAGKIAFSIDNPSLGEEASCPFTAKLTFEPKTTTDRGTAYDATIDYTLEVNAYYSNGEAVVDSGHVIKESSNLPAANLSAFQSQVAKYGFPAYTYKTFFCKTVSGQWHIGTERQ